jgi:thiamine biosynthesis lipoprotein ApbE
MLPLALFMQRWSTFAVGSLALLAGGVWGGFQFGLWVAALVVGFLCLGLGATLHEWALHRKSQRRDQSPESAEIYSARMVKASGIGYVAVASLAGWTAIFHPLVMVLSLGGILADFAADHWTARRIIG